MMLGCNFKPSWFRPFPKHRNRMVEHLNPNISLKSANDIDET